MRLVRKREVGNSTEIYPTVTYAFRTFKSCTFCMHISPKNDLLNTFYLTIAFCNIFLSLQRIDEQNEWTTPMGFLPT